MLPLPLDRFNFGTLRRAGEVYVDKTSYIQRMLEERVQFAFLARPRRFGKSLLVSAMAHLFARTDDALFRDLDIAAYLPRVPRLPVIALNMAEVGGNSPREMRDDLRDMVRYAGARFGVAVPDDMAPRRALRRLFEQVEKTCGQCIVLVDEYDAPLTGIMTRAAFAPRDQEETQADLREFYRTLKNWERVIHFAFITGILDIGGSGLFSALNNLRHLSDDARYDALCGFTEDEIDRFLRPHIEAAARHMHCTPDEMRRVLRAHYNGYRFSPQGEGVYNPISYLTVLDRLATPATAQDVIDTGLPHPWVKSGQSLFLFKRIQARGTPLTENDMSAGGVRDALNLQKPTLNALLFQAGYTTFKRVRGAPALGFPNAEVRTAFYQGLFAHWFGEPAGRGSRLFRLIRQMGAAFERGDCAAGLAAFDQALDGLNYAVLQTESHFQLAFQIFCEVASDILGAAEWSVEAERLTRWGRTDLVLETSDAIYVIECKLNQSVDAALQQIVEKDYLGAFAGRNKPAIGIGVNFDRPSGDVRREAAKANYQWDAIPGSDAAGDVRERPGRA